MAQIDEQTFVIGGKKTIDAVVDSSTAEKINKNANKNVENARVELDRQRKETGESIEHLGELKLNVLDHDVLDFVNTFEKIKNIDFQSSIGLDELKDLHIDQNTFLELKELGNFALEVAGGASAGAVGGALTAIGAYRDSSPAQNPRKSLSTLWPIRHRRTKSWNR